LGSKVIIATISGAVLLCVIGLIIAGHVAYVKIAAHEYAGQGNAYLQQRNYSLAIAAYSKSLQLSPHQPRVLASRGFTFAQLEMCDQQGSLDYSTAITMLHGQDTGSLAYCAELHYYRALVYGDLHRDREELVDLHSCLLPPPAGMRRSSRLFAEANNDIAWLLATSPDSSLRNGGEAVCYAQQAVTSARGTQLMAYCNDSLAAAEARVGQYSIAMTKLQDSIALLDSIHDVNRSHDQQQRLQLYQQGKPYTAIYRNDGKSFTFHVGTPGHPDLQGIRDMRKQMLLHQQGKPHTAEYRNDKKSFTSKGDHLR